MSKNRWKGLVSLLQDAVVHGASAVERIHLEQSKLPFQILEQIPDVERPAKVVHAVHDAVVKGSYSSVRLVTRVVATTVNAALDVIEEEDRPKNTAGGELAGN